MLAENCMHLEAGVKSDFFNLSFFIDSLIKYLPWCAVLSLMMLVLYIIKHKFSVLQFVIPYFILALLVWMLVIPGCAKLFSIRQGASEVSVSEVAEIADAEAVEGVDAQVGGEVVDVIELDVIELDVIEPDAETVSKGYFRKEGEYLTFGDMWRRKVFQGRVDEETSGKYSDIIIESSVRELYSCIRRASVLCDGSKIEMSDIRSNLNKDYEPSPELCRGFEASPAAFEKTFSMYAASPSERAARARMPFQKSSISGLPVTEKKPIF